MIISTAIARNMLRMSPRRSETRKEIENKMHAIKKHFRLRRDSLAGDKCCIWWLN